LRRKSKKLLSTCKNQTRLHQDLDFRICKFGYNRKSNAPWSS